MFKNTVYEIEDKIIDFPEKEKRLMSILDEQTCYFERAKMRKEAKCVAMQKSKTPKDKAKNKHHGLE